MATTSLIDPVAVARKVVADPRAAFTISHLGIAAVCAALVEQADNPQPIISTVLADAARDLIAAEATHTMSKGEDGYAPLKIGLAREQAFLTFKTLFETEFPNE